MARPHVVGTLSYTLLAPCGPRDLPASCEGNGGYQTWVRWLSAKGCAIADAYAEISARARGEGRAL